ncbi:MAG: hypothetical protein ACRDT2_11035, partial [Natronosporangium sp.]
MSRSRSPASATAGPRAGDWLVVGGLHHVNGSAGSTARDPWLLVPLPGLRAGDPEAGWRDNTVLLRWVELGSLEVRAVSRDRSVSRVGRTTGGQLFDRLLPGRALLRLAGAASPGSASPGSASPGPASP